MLRARVWHFLPVVAVVVALCGGDVAAQNTSGGMPQGAGPDTVQLHRPVHLTELRALRSFFERVDVRSVADGVASPRTSGSMALDAVLRSLPSDWEAPFSFVQGAIRHVPYSGSVRGVSGTLESGGGNAVDQALLLQSLLQARGVRSRLVRGQLQWSDAARLVLGSVTPAAPRSDDPWPRWLEAAADHWWVQAERDGEWVDLDAAFADTEPGQAVGRAGQPLQALPAALQTTVRVELLRGDLTVAEATLPASAVAGHGVSLSLAAQSEQAVALWQATEDALHRQAQWIRQVVRRLGPLPAAPGGIRSDVVAPAAGTAPPAARPTLPARLPRPSLVRRLFLDSAAGPWQARLELPGRTLEAGRFVRADLNSLLVRITVLAPQAPPHVLRAPWGGGVDGRLTIVVGAGPVADERLITQARAMYRALNRLAVIEQEARVDMRPPIDYWSAKDRLVSAARAEWDFFIANAPATVGWVLLRAVDRVSAQSPSGRVVRPGLRLVAVRWREPDVGSAAAFEVLMSDPITIGQLTGSASVASLQSAHGLLQSAVFSQVLNRITDRAPETAFDVTLRAIGTGQALRAFVSPAELPQGWPATARAEAAMGVAAGYRVLAPDDFGDGGPGWWNVGVADGTTQGWVPGLQAALHGRVEVGAAGRRDQLEALLASLPSLHRALRWLAELPGSGPVALSSVPAAACGSAAVAAEVMRDSLPADWPHPDVLAFCGPR